MDLIFEKALPVLETLEQAGYEAYFVGGAVRDYLLKRDVNDVDIATSAFPSEVKQLFRKTYDTGIQHGTVTVRQEGELYEVTTFRTEGKYVDFRRPSEVHFVRSLEEDLLRRDFTMNAIAMDKTGKLHDPFLGETAIWRREIKAVGEAKHRFREDALRIMRAVRFLSQLEFTLEEKTRQALNEEVDLLAHTAVERIRVEWVKLVQGKGRIKAFELITEIGMERYLPGLLGQKEALKRLARFRFSEIPSEDLVWLSLVLARQPDSVRAFLRAWKLSNQQIKRTEQAYTWIQTGKPWTKYSLYQAGAEGIRLVEAGKALIGEANDVESILVSYEALPIHASSEIVIDGRFLMAFYEKAGGPWLRELLTEIEEKIVLGELPNEEEAIRRWLLDD
ncbi:CCA tRNA nucleotidyltransferase [Listeria aquatica]|uniref:CCA-adding enzyme n=1 Tax=Listeria aquatica TaxID=1494960 RepID=A0A841ZKC3_9LIST|nr:CCA tRNA nucleotidyltransferase [Listeria aquatica]MBC1520543.1 CCA tRNA nucleotidyltransferase [Listeria aquatica]